jgi:hypothetical protein
MTQSKASNLLRVARTFAQPTPEWLKTNARGVTGLCVGALFRLADPYDLGSRAQKALHNVASAICQPYTGVAPEESLHSAAAQAAPFMSSYDLIRLHEPSLPTTARVIHMAPADVESEVVPAQRLQARIVGAQNHAASRTRARAEIRDASTPHQNVVAIRVEVVAGNFTSAAPAPNSPQAPPAAERGETRATSASGLSELTTAHDNHELAASFDARRGVAAYRAQAQYGAHTTSSSDTAARPRLSLQA